MLKVTKIQYDDDSESRVFSALAMMLMLFRETKTGFPPALKILPSQMAFSVEDADWWILRPFYVCRLEPVRLQAPVWWSEHV